MCHAVGGAQGDLQRGGVGDSGAVHVGRRRPGLLRQPANLVPGPVYQRDRDAQTAQQRNVEENVAEVLVLDHGPVNGNDKDLVAETRHITQNLTQVR